MVKRWYVDLVSRFASMRESANGEYVLASDYDAIAAEVERLKSDIQLMSAPHESVGAVVLGYRAEVERLTDLAEMYKERADSATERNGQLINEREALAADKARSMVENDDLRTTIADTGRGFDAMCNEMADGLQRLVDAVDGIGLKLDHDPSNEGGIPVAVNVKCGVEQAVALVGAVREVMGMVRDLRDTHGTGAVIEGEQKGGA